MIIRDSSETDWKGLARVYNLARAKVSCFSSGELSLQQFKSISSNEEIQLATEGEEVIGFVSIWPPERFVHHLYVQPDFQNKGVANTLIEAGIARYGLPLTLKSLVANTIACKFYEKNNWVILGTGYGSEGAYHHYSLERRAGD